MKLLFHFYDGTVINRQESRATAARTQYLVLARSRLQRRDLGLQGVNLRLLFLHRLDERHHQKKESIPMP
jgi:hypothetical protein